jgi:hypothetical protein
MGGKASKENKKDGIYAEIVTGKEEAAQVPPLKVFIPDFKGQITSTAVDSLKDSEDMMYKLAKDLIADVLKDKDTPKRFGKLMQHYMTYDSTQKTTRDFLYWTVDAPDCYDGIKQLSAWQMKDYFNSFAPGQVSLAAQAWVLAIPSRKEVICPLLTWTLQQQPIVIDPLTTIIKDVLPYSRVRYEGGSDYFMPPY